MKHVPLSRTPVIITGAAVGVAAVVAAALAVSAPANAIPPSGQDASYTQAHTVDIVGTNTMTTDSFKIDTHGTVHAGLVKIRFTNAGIMEHQAQLFRLKDGVSYAKFHADLTGKNPGAALFVDGQSAGGAAAGAPGREQTVYETVQGGTYAVVCLVRGRDGVPHFDKGMVGDFTVAGQLTPQQLAAYHPADHVAGTIMSHDMTYTMPAVLRDGALYRYQDTDAMDVHELTFGRLLPGKTVADAKAWFMTLAKPGGPTAPPPFTDYGGFGSEVPGGGGWVRADLTPGNYIAFCLVPDDKTHVPHAAMGMVVGFKAVGDSDGDHDGD